MTAPKPFTRAVVVDHGEEAGITWATCKAPRWGAINGYARVPEGHPWRDTGGDSVPADVNGGITYNMHGGEWIGFDTLHSYDYWPEMPWVPDAYSTHWTADMVADEARCLARQIAEAAQ